MAGGRTGRISEFSVSLRPPGSLSRRKSVCEGRSQPQFLFPRERGQVLSAAVRPQRLERAGLAGRRQIRRHVGMFRFYGAAAARTAIDDADLIYRLLQLFFESPARSAARRGSLIFCTVRSIICSRHRSAAEWTNIVPV